MAGKKKTDGGNKKASTKPFGGQRDKTDSQKGDKTSNKDSGKKKS